MTVPQTDPALRIKIHLIASLAPPSPGVPHSALVKVETAAGGVVDAAVTVGRGSDAALARLLDRNVPVGAGADFVVELEDLDVTRGPAVRRLMRSRGFGLRYVPPAPAALVPPPAPDISPSEWALDFMRSAPAHSGPEPVGRPAPDRNVPETLLAKRDDGRICIAVERRTLRRLRVHGSGRPRRLRRSDFIGCARRDVRPSAAVMVPVAVGPARLRPGTRVLLGHGKGRRELVYVRPAENGKLLFRDLAKTTLIVSGTIFERYLRAGAAVLVGPGD